jgi:hypothetical protein
MRLLLFLLGFFLLIIPLTQGVKVDVLNYYEGVYPHEHIPSSDTLKKIKNHFHQQYQTSLSMDQVTKIMLFSMAMDEDNFLLKEDFHFFMNIYIHILIREEKKQHDIQLELDEIVRYSLALQYLEKMGVDKDAFMNEHVK